MLGSRTSDDVVPSLEAGTPGKGQYRCAECGYGITIHDELPTCPMCAGTAWELTPWSPVGNARRGAERRALL